jgi:hypothetical protein
VELKKKMKKTLCCFSAISPFSIPSHSYLSANRSVTRLILQGYKPSAKEKSILQKQIRKKRSKKKKWKKKRKKKNKT